MVFENIIESLFHDKKIQAVDSNGDDSLEISYGTWRRMAILPIPVILTRSETYEGVPLHLSLTSLSNEEILQVVDRFIQMCFNGLDTTSYVLSFNDSDQTIEDFSFSVGDTRYSVHLWIMNTVYLDNCCPLRTCYLWIEEDNET